MKLFPRSVAAGLMISIGTTIYLVSDSKVAGALLFTVGLFCICSFGMNLFTGKIAYVLENRNQPNCLIIWLGNFLGCVVFSGLVRIAKPDLHEKAAAMVSAKLALPWYSVLILGFMCGVLMYMAVENYLSGRNDFGKVVGLFLCVSAFILCGFEHSVADMSYCVFAVSGFSEGVRMLGFLLLVSLANSVGAVTVRMLTRDARVKNADFKL